MNANHAARELLLNPDFVCRVRTIAQKRFWPLQTFSLWHTKSKACDEPENKVFG
jgi:hypothetical protein